MNTLRTRIARLTAASVLALGLGALAAGPALAGGTWAGSVPPDSVTLAVGDGAGTDPAGLVAPQLCHASRPNCVA